MIYVTVCALFLPGNAAKPTQTLPLLGIGPGKPRLGLQEGENEIHCLLLVRLSSSGNVPGHAAPCRGAQDGGKGPGHMALRMPQGQTPEPRLSQKSDNGPHSSHPFPPGRSVFICITRTHCSLYMTVTVKY